MKAPLLWLAAVITLVLIGALLLWQQDRTKRFSAESALTEQQAKTIYWQTEAGKTVSSKPAAEITKADLQEHYQDIAAELKDMKIKLNQVKAVLKATIEASGEGVGLIVHDTVLLATGPESRDSLVTNDGYLNHRIAANNAGYKYTYRDSILFALVRKRKGWFGKESLYGEVKMSNPASRSIGQTSILIRERQKRFNVSVGAGYDPFSNSVRPGVFIGYSLIKL